jgi:hypothetical protein
MVVVVHAGCFAAEAAQDGAFLWKAVAGEGVRATKTAGETSDHPPVPPSYLLALPALALRPAALRACGL